VVETTLRKYWKMWNAEITNGREKLDVSLQDRREIDPRGKTCELE
jgi:hypothetical protein